jgi:hypothetical protein
MNGRRTINNKIMEEEKDEYWNCVIGPTKRSELPHGADFPLRWVVREKFEEMLGRDAEICSSGWGMDEETKSICSRISLLSITDPSGDKLRRIIEVLDSGFLNFPDLEK